MKFQVLYRGIRTGMEAVVMKSGMMERELPLTESLRYVRHSPTGFEWGYLGSGPSQLAFALLLDNTTDGAYAESAYMQFKEDCVAWMPKKGWELTAQEIEQWREGRIGVDYFKEKWGAPDERGGS